MLIVQHERALGVPLSPVESDRGVHHRLPVIVGGLTATGSGAGMVETEHVPEFMEHDGLQNVHDNVRTHGMHVVHW